MASNVSPDSYTYLESTSREDTHPVFVSKQWTYQIDQNNSNYSSKQIVFDLSGFYNSQRFINPQEMVLVMPVVSVLTAGGGVSGCNGLGVAPSLPIGQTNFDPTTNGGQVTDQYAFGFKSGFWQLIQSMQVQVDGKDVIQLTPDLNYYVSFVANTSWSRSDLDKYSQMLGYYPDDEDCWMINAIPNDTAKNNRRGYTGTTASVSKFGVGVCSNLVSDGVDCFLAASLAGSSLAGADVAQRMKRVNWGFLKRMKDTNKFDAASYCSGGLTTASGIFSSANLQVGFFTVQEDDRRFTWENHMECEAITYRSAAVASANIQAGFYNSDLAATKSISPGLNSVGDVNDKAVAILTGAVASASNCADSQASTAYRALYTLAIIRFKDICNLFSKLPLTRGLYIRLTINVNTGYCDIATGGLAAGGSSQCALNPSGIGNAIVAANAAWGTQLPDALPAYGAVTNNTFSNTCPLMVSALQSSALVGAVVCPNPVAGALPVAGATCTSIAYQLPIYPNGAGIVVNPGMAVDYGSCSRTALHLSCAIAKPDMTNHTAFAGTNPVNHSLQQCRVYVPIVDLSPSLTSDYITSYKEQAIYYRDVLKFAYTAFAPNTNMNYQVVNGIANAKRLIIIPFYKDNTTVQAGGAATTSLNGTTYSNMYFQPISPYDSAPATTAPGFALTDFNVLISNVTVFQLNKQYAFEDFMQEVAPVNALNGGLDVGLTSGLIDFGKWVNNYRYYVVDLSRRLAGDNTPKSITIIGKNYSPYNVDLHIYIEYERHLSLDVETGHLTISSN